MREQTIEHKPKIAISKLRFVAQPRRVAFFLVAVASLSGGLQLQIGYAQNPSEQLTPDTKTPAVQNSITDVTANPAPEKGDQVNVKTYGAVGDGVTDDTAAFNAALDSLADAGGGVCLVPRGTYIISASGITSHVKSGVHLVGEGRASILKIAAVPTGHRLPGRQLAGRKLFCSQNRLRRNKRQRRQQLEHRKKSHRQDRSGTDTE